MWLVNLLVILALHALVWHFGICASMFYFALTGAVFLAIAGAIQLCRWLLLRSSFSFKEAVFLSAVSSPFVFALFGYWYLALPIFVWEFAEVITFISAILEREPTLEPQPKFSYERLTGHRCKIIAHLPDGTTHERIVLTFPNPNANPSSNES